MSPTGKGDGDGVCTLDKKSIPIVAWYVLSNESYMNLVIRDVFPTARPCQKPLSKEHLSKLSRKHTTLFSQKHQPIIRLATCLNQYKPQRIKNVLKFLQRVRIGPYPSRGGHGVDKRRESGVVYRDRGGQHEAQMIEEQ